MIKVLVDGIARQKGGIGEMIMSIYRKIDKTKIQFDFAIINSSIYEEEIESLGGKCYILPRWKQHPKEHETKFIEIVQANKYDIIWINSSSKLNINRIKKTKQLTNTKVIYHVHGTKNEYKGIAKIICTMLEMINKRKFYKNIDYPFACSQLAADYFYDRKLLGNKQIKIINNAIDIEKYRYSSEFENAYRKQFNIENKKVIFMAGRLAQVKNIPFAIKVFEKLFKIDNEYVLIIAGGGEEKENLENIIKEKGLETQIRLIGQRNDIAQLYSMADILILPSVSEGFPVAIIEAQAAGIKCFLSDSITKEVNITNTCEYLKLDDQEWVEKIIDFKLWNKKEKSDIHAKILKENNYDSSTYHETFLKILMEIASNDKE